MRMVDGMTINDQITPGQFQANGSSRVRQEVCSCDIETLTRDRARD